MKMYVLNNGFIVMSANNQVTANSDKEEAPTIPIHSFLFETEKGWILFDSGCDPEGMTKNWPEHMRANPYIAGSNGSIEQQLAILNLKPEDINYVVMSHLHLDHAGSLALFKNAAIYVSQEEFFKTLHAYADHDFSGFHMKTDISSWLRAELTWHFITSEAKELELCKGLTILNFGPGHSYGMLGLLVELKQDGTFLLAADAIYTSDHLGPPAKMAGIAYDSDGYFSTVERIRQLAEKHQAKILLGHDTKQFESLKKVGEGFYH